MCIEINFVESKNLGNNVKSMIADLKSREFLNPSFRDLEPDGTIYGLLYDNDVLIGYMGFVPISDSTYNKIVSDEEVISIHQLPIEVKDISYAYLFQICLNKNYRGNGLGKFMIAQLMKYDILHEWNGVISTVYSSEGESLLNNCGFDFIKGYTSYKLYEGGAIGGWRFTLTRRHW